MPTCPAPLMSTVSDSADRGMTFAGCMSGSCNFQGHPAAHGVKNIAFQDSRLREGDEDCAALIKSIFKSYSHLSVPGGLHIL